MESDPIHIEPSSFLVVRLTRQQATVYDKKTGISISAKDLLENIVEIFSKNDQKLKQAWAKRLVFLVNREHQIYKQTSTVKKVFIQRFLDFSQTLKNLWKTDPELLMQCLMTLTKEEFQALPPDIRNDSVKQFREILSKNPDYVETYLLPMDDSDILTMPSQILKICLSKLTDPEKLHQDSVTKLVDLFPFILDLHPDVKTTEIQYYNDYHSKYLTQPKKEELITIDEDQGKEEQEEDSSYSHYTTGSSHSYVILENSEYVFPERPEIKALSLEERGKLEEELKNITDIPPEKANEIQQKLDALESHQVGTILKNLTREQRDRIMTNCIVPYLNSLPLQRFVGILSPLSLRLHEFPSEIFQNRLEKVKQIPVKHLATVLSNLEEESLSIINARVLKPLIRDLRLEELPILISPLDPPETGLILEEATAEIRDKVRLPENKELLFPFLETMQKQKQLHSLPPAVLDALLTELDRMKHPQLLSFIKSLPIKETAVLLHAAKLPALQSLLTAEIAREYMEGKFSFSYIDAPLQNRVIAYLEENRQLAGRRDKMIEIIQQAHPQTLQKLSLPVAKHFLDSLTQLDDEKARLLLFSTGSFEGKPILLQFLASYLSRNSSPTALNFLRLLNSWQIHSLLKEMQAELLPHWEDFAKVFKSKLNKEEKKEIISFLKSSTEAELQFAAQPLFGLLDSFEEAEKLQLLQSLPLSQSLALLSTPLFPKEVVQSFLKTIQKKSFQEFFRSTPVDQLQEKLSPQLTAFLSRMPKDMAIMLVALRPEVSALLAQKLKIPPGLVASEYLPSLSPEDLFLFCQHITTGSDLWKAATEHAKQHVRKQPLKQILLSLPNNEKRTHLAFLSPIFDQMDPAELIEALKSIPPPHIHSLLAYFLPQEKIGHALQTFDQNKIQELPAALLARSLDPSMEHLMSVSQKKQISREKVISFIYSLNPKESLLLLEPYLSHLSEEDLIDVILSLPTEWVAALPLQGIPEKKWLRVAASLSRKGIHLAPSLFVPEVPLARINSLTSEIERLSASERQACPMEVLLPILDALLRMKHSLTKREEPHEIEKWSKEDVIEQIQTERTILADLMKSDREQPAPSLEKQTEETPIGGVEEQEELSDEEESSPPDRFGTFVQAQTTTEEEVSPAMLELSARLTQGTPTATKSGSLLPQRLQSLTAEEIAAPETAKQLQEQLSQTSLNVIGKTLQTLPSSQVKTLMPILAPWMKSLKPLDFADALKYFAADDLFEEIPEEVYRFQINQMINQVTPINLVLKASNFELKHLLILSAKILNKFIDKQSLHSIMQAFKRFPENLKSQADFLFEELAEVIAKKLNTATKKEIYSFFSSLISKKGFLKEDRFQMFLEHVSNDVKRSYYSMLAPQAMASFIAKLTPGEIEQHIAPFLSSYAEEVKASTLLLTTDKTIDPRSFRERSTLDLLEMVLSGLTAEQKAVIPEDVYRKVQKEFLAMTDEQKLVHLNSFLGKKEYDLKPAIFVFHCLSKKLSEGEGELSFTSQPYFETFLSRLSFRHQLAVLSSLDLKQIPSSLLQKSAASFVRAAASGPRKKNRALHALQFASPSLQQALLPDLVPYLKAVAGTELFRFLNCLHQTTIEKLSPKLKEDCKREILTLPPSLIQQLSGEKIAALFTDSSIRQNQDEFTTMTESEMTQLIRSLGPLQLAHLLQNPSIAASFEKKLSLLNSDSLPQFLDSLHPNQLQSFPQSLLTFLVNIVLSQESIQRAADSKEVFEKLAKLPPKLLQAFPQTHIQLCSEILSKKTSTTQLAAILQSLTEEQIRNVFSISSFASVLEKRKNDIVAWILPKISAEKTAALSECLQISPSLLRPHLHTYEQKSLLSFVRSLSPSSEMQKPETLYSVAAEEINQKIAPRVLIGEMMTWPPRQLYSLLFPLVSQLALSESLHSMSSKEIQTLPVPLLLPFLDESLRNKMAVSQQNEISLCQSIAFIWLLNEAEDHPLLEAYLQNLSAQDLATLMRSISSKKLASLPWIGIPFQKMRDVFQRFSHEELLNLPVPLLQHFKSIIPPGVLPENFFDHTENTRRVLESELRIYQDRLTLLGEMATEFRSLPSQQIAQCPVEILQPIFDEMMAMRKALQKSIDSERTKPAAENQEGRKKTKQLEMSLKLLNLEIVKIFRAQEILLKTQDESFKKWTENEMKKREILLQTQDESFKKWIDDELKKKEVLK